MRRREFIAGATGSALLWPSRARAQSLTHVPLIVLWLGSLPTDPEMQVATDAFREVLRRHGWAEGRNIRIVTRSYAASFSAEDLDAAAADLAALSPNVIVTTGAPILGALHRQTKTIPIVFTQVTDPVGDGFVANLARPGGNITGFTIFEHSFSGKWLEMLKEVAPSVTRVLVMQTVGHPAWNAYLRAIRAIATGMDVEVATAPIGNPAEVEPALAEFARKPNGALILLPSPLGTRYREMIATAALRHHLPSIYMVRLFAASGGLMTYGPVLAEPYRQAATYVDRLLRGAKPGDLPVQAASKFEMVINMKTAKALGVVVPATMLGRADEVIE